MGFFRRRQESRVDRPEPPAGVDVPPGMVAVPDDQIMDMAAQLSDEASELAVTKPAPNFVDLMAKVTLPQLYGAEGSAEFPGGAQLLGYNLCLLGYWCRAVEMRAVQSSEVAPSVSGYLEVAHERG